MLRYFYVLLFVALAPCVVLFGQKNKGCDKIYDNPNTKAIFGKTNSDLTNYFGAEILPLISKCVDRDKITTANLSVRFTIDKRGKVAGVTIESGEMTSVCREELTNKLMRMTRWRPAKTNGQFVCSKYEYSVSCINWVTE